MVNRRELLKGAAFAAIALQLGGGRAFAATGSFPITLTDEEWRKRLTPDQYEVLRKEGTEYPGSSPLLHEKRRGNFACAGCDQEAFSSTTKFESGTGWPSFWAPWKTRSAPHRTPLLEWCERRSIAPVAAVIWAMFSMMDPSQPVFAIA